MDYLGVDVRARGGETEKENTQAGDEERVSASTGEEEGRQRRRSWALHSYRVTWSEPTRSRPVPIATACVYFFLKTEKEVSHIWP